MTSAAAEGSRISRRPTDVKALLLLSRHWHKNSARAGCGTGGTRKWFGCDGKLSRHALQPVHKRERAPDTHTVAPMEHTKLESSPCPELQSRANKNNNKNNNSSNKLPAFSTSLQAKSLDLGSSVRPVTSVAEFENIVTSQGSEAVVIDLRPFNQYNVSRVKDALSICVPTTLLRRSSFHLSNIFKTMVDSQETELESKLASNSPLKIVFYDSTSSMKHCSPHLHQIIKKFQESAKDYSKSIEMYMVDRGFAMFSSNDGVIDSSRFKVSSGDQASFCTFMLPSADPSSSFLMSMKRNTAPQTHVNNFEVPKFQSLDQFPKWLQRYTLSDAAQTMVNNFTNIEAMENARIGALARRSVTNSPEVQLLGSEYGFKNRYPNILPYEHSCVKLVPSPMSAHETPHSTFVRTLSTGSLSPGSATTTKRGDDYFNANFLSVPVVNPDMRYIATQAPLPTTVSDFWKVVWYNGVEIVISLTDLTENGTLKSDVYWHNSSTVQLLSEEDDFRGFKNLTMRRIQLMRRGETRTITQLYFKAWPDFGVVDCKDLLRLIEIKDSLVNDGAKPLVVHCSAGCGRTGVFITIDLLLSAYKRYRKDDKHEFDVWSTDEDLVNYTVQQLRKQRISMVQSVDQFVFCYMALLEYLANE